MLKETYFLQERLEVIKKKSKHLGKIRVYKGDHLDIHLIKVPYTKMFVVAPTTCFNVAYVILSFPTLHRGFLSYDLA